MWNVKVNLAPLFRSFDEKALFLAVTLWLIESSNCHVTGEPTATVTVLGLNAKFLTWTSVPPVVDEPPGAVEPAGAGAEDVDEPPVAEDFLELLQAVASRVTASRAAMPRSSGGRAGGSFRFTVGSFGRMVDAVVCELHAARTESVHRGRGKPCVGFSG